MAERRLREGPAPVRAASSADRPVTRDELIDEYVAVAYPLRPDGSLDDRAVDCLEIKFLRDGSQMTRVKLRSSQRALQSLRRAVSPKVLKELASRQRNPASRRPDDYMLADPTARRRAGAWLQVVNLAVSGITGADLTCAPLPAGDDGLTAPAAAIESQ